jgi:ankyrin repeat protein
MLRSRCSLEAFQERMLSSEFDAASDGDLVYQESWVTGPQEVCTWIRSPDFASRVGVIPFENQLKIFFHACWQGDEEYVSRMVAEHPEWLHRDCEYARVPVLHAMARGGLMKFIPDIVAESGGADPVCCVHETPIMEACRGGQLETFKYFLSLGVEIRMLNYEGASLLHVASQGGNTAIVKELLDLGLEIDARDSCGLTPLHSACWLGHLEVAKVLCEHGASVEARSYDGSTPMLTALQHRHLDIVRYLLERGVRSCELYRSCHALMVLAIRSDSVPMMQLLLEIQACRVSKKLVQHCVFLGVGSRWVLRDVLLREDCPANLLDDVDGSMLPEGWLGKYLTVSDWRARKRGGDTRYFLLAWRRAFVASRLT